MAAPRPSSVIPALLGPFFTKGIVLGAFLVGLCSCSTVVLPVPGPAECTLPNTLPVAPLTITGKTYHAYGDSITYGFLLPTTQDAYPYLVASSLALDVSDFAVPGSVACDVPARQIFPFGENPSAASNMLFSLMIGTNDSNYNVAGYESVFNQCHQATVAWLAVPAESKIRAYDPNVSTTGGGAFDSTDGWGSWVTTTLGASVTFPITLPADQAIYIWPRIIDDDKGTYSYAVDGNVVGSANTSTKPSIHAESTLSGSLSFIRIPSIPAGKHRVTLTQTSATGTMQIVAVGTPPATGSPMPNVLVSDIPYTLNKASTGCTGTATPSLVYLALIQTTVALFKQDGLQVTYVPTRKYMFATHSEMIDKEHPNQLGHAELSQAFQASLQ